MTTKHQRQHRITKLLETKAVGSQTHLVEQLRNPLPFPAACQVMYPDHFDQRLGDSQPRVQRSVRILQHHLDPPAYGAQLVPPQTSEVDPVQLNFA